MKAVVLNLFPFLQLPHKMEFLLHVSFSFTCNNLANALPIDASLIVSIRKSTFSVPLSVKHQNLKFRQISPPDYYDWVTSISLSVDLSDFIQPFFP